jgi:hypothetical protein
MVPHQRPFRRPFSPPSFRRPRPFAVIPAHPPLPSFRRIPLCRHSGDRRESGIPWVRPEKDPGRPRSRGCRDDGLGGPCLQGGLQRPPRCRHSGDLSNPRHSGDRRESGIPLLQPGKDPGRAALAGMTGWVGRASRAASSARPVAVIPAAAPRCRHSGDRPSLPSFRRPPLVAVIPATEGSPESLGFNQGRIPDALRLPG